MTPPALTPLRRGIIPVMDDIQKFAAIWAAVARYHEFADGETPAVRGGAGDKLAERIEAALRGEDWRELEA